PHERGRFDRAMAWFIYPHLDAVVVHSEEQAALARSIGCSEIIMRPLPFHFDGRASQAPTNSAVRNQLAFFGFVRPHKGLDVLIEAIAKSATKPRLEVRGEFWEKPDRYERLIRE